MIKNRFVSNAKILELAAAKHANKKKNNQLPSPSPSPSLQLLQKVDDHFSSSSTATNNRDKCEPFEMKTDELNKIVSESFKEKTSPFINTSQHCWYPPPASDNNNRSKLTSLLLLSLAQRGNIIKLSSDKHLQHDASSLYYQFVKSRLFSNLECENERVQKLDWLERGLFGQTNMKVDHHQTTTSCDVDAKNMIIQMMTLPPKLHQRFSNFLKFVIQNVLNKNGITNHWACGGTLLGAMRRERSAFIPHDDDIDLVVAPDEGEGEGEFDLRLRKALRLSTSSLSSSEDNNVDDSNNSPDRFFFVEPAPLFGYKVFAGPEFYNNSDGVGGDGCSFCSDWMTLAPFGIFVDLFVLRKSDESGNNNNHDNNKFELELAFDQARRTWPKETWSVSSSSSSFSTTIMTAGEMFPQRYDETTNNNKQKTQEEKDSSLRLFPACLQLPPTREDCVDYLDRVFGKEWNDVCVIPKSAHGKTLDKEVRFRME